MNKVKGKVLFRKHSEYQRSDINHTTVCINEEIVS